MPHLETMKDICHLYDWLDCSLLGAIGNALYETSGQSFALSRIWFEFMPHNGNYLRNILRQRLQDYRPAGEGSRKKYNAIQVKVFTSRKDTVWNLVYSYIHVPAQ